MTGFALWTVLVGLAGAEEPLAVPVDAAPVEAAPSVAAPVDTPIGFTTVVVPEGFVGSTSGAGDLTVVDVLQLAADAGYRTAWADEAPLLVGGELREGRCMMRPTAVACELAIRWSVRDAASDAPVYEVLSRGFAVDPSGSRSTGRKAAVEAFRDLLGRAGFQRVVRGAVDPAATAGDAPTPARMDAWLAATPLEPADGGRRAKR